MFTFRIKYLKGDTNCAADALSRYPILSGEPERSDEDEEELVCAAMTAATVAAAEDEMGHVVDLRQVEEEAEQDEEYRLLRECVANDGWAERKDWEPPALRPYFRMRRHLSSQGSVVLYTCDEKHPRLVVPAALRRTVLANLHAGHQGRDSMLRRARQSVYWPGIDAEVEQKRRQSSRHNQSAHNLEPLTPGQRTHIQNPSSGRWDRAGTVLETTAPRQYLVRLDGSGRATIRNRRHLRPLTREPHTQASDDGAAATPDPTPPTQRRPQRSRRAPRHLYDYVLGDTTP
ncbi:hypothetical protein O3P69_002280 [Scylla paramamosain]|uniref:RNA-directed DNA polymerase n=1 Tax=Scylla paramamosain TaxID=85552 RepID=A0AAW0V5L1_SCYPA